MSYQIDQSGKVEQTERHSIIACTNNRTMTIFLAKKEKRIIQKIFRGAGYGKFFPYLTFSAMLAILIFKNKLFKKITIDREYSGHEEFIKTHAIQYLELLGEGKIPVINFGHVGKLSRSHHEAYSVAIGKKKPTLVTDAREILRIVLGIKK